MGSGPSALSDKARNFVEKILQQFKVVIFMKSKCHICLSTAKLLASFVPHIIQFNEYREVDVENDSDICNYLELLTGKSTFPLVFVEGIFIGGASDALQKANTGRLRNMLVTKVDKGVQVDVDADLGKNSGVNQSLDNTMKRSGDDNEAGPSPKIAKTTSRGINGVPAPLFSPPMDAGQQPAEAGAPAARASASFL